jgi:hypothetical protein
LPAVLVFTSAGNETSVYDWNLPACNFIRRSGILAFNPSGLLCLSLLWRMVAMMKVPVGLLGHVDVWSWDLTRLAGIVFL